MLKDVVENAVWTKTKSLIQDKYGKKIDFKTINISNTSAPFYLNGDDLVVPLYTRATHLGEVIVNRGSLLNTEQKSEVVDLIKFLIEPHVYHKHLSFKEEMSQLENTNDSTYLENVYTLFDEEEDRCLVNLVSNIIHLKASSELKRKKVALKIHEMAEQNMFIHFVEIAKQIHSAEELRSFNKTTFYIEDLATLSLMELSLLDSACALKNSGLVFVIGSNMSEAEIANLAISQTLKNDLSAILFDIDRVPMSQQTSTDVLELLFFNVDQMNRS